MVFHLCRRIWPSVAPSVKVDGALCPGLPACTARLVAAHVQQCDAPQGRQQFKSIRPAAGADPGEPRPDGTSRLVGRNVQEGAAEGCV